MDVLAYNAAKRAERFARRGQSPRSIARRFQASYNNDTAQWISGLAAGRTYHVPFTVSQTGSSLLVDFDNWDSSGSGGAEQGAGYTITVKAEIVDASGYIYPIYFNGSRATTIEQLGRATGECSAALEKSDVAFLRTFVSVPADTNKVPAVLNSPGNDAWYKDGDQMGVAAPASTTSVSSGWVYTASSIRARTFDPAVPCVAIVGDSILNGQGDSFLTSLFTPLNATYPETLGTGPGFAQRAFDPVGMNWRKVCIPGGALGNLVVGDALGGSRRIQTARGCTTAIVHMGINDLNAGAGYASLLTKVTTICKKLKALGVERVYVTTVLPRLSATTDQAATLGGQTVFAGASNRQSFNAGIRAGVSGATGYIDLAAVVESGTTGKWSTPGRTASIDTVNSSATITAPANSFNLGDVVQAAGIPANSVVISRSGTSFGLSGVGASATASGVAAIATYTNDGTHPAPSGCIALAAAVNTALFG